MINKAESDVYSSALGKAVAAASYSNYEATVVLDKTLIFKERLLLVVLGRYDGIIKANSFPVQENC
jgi:hypothetical protein